MHIFASTVFDDIAHDVAYWVLSIPLEWQVTIQGLEMSQNSLRVQWTAEEVDMRLQEVMKDIYQKSIKVAQDYGIGNP